MNIMNALLGLGIALVSVGALGTFAGLVAVVTPYASDMRAGRRLLGICVPTLIVGAVLIGAVS